MKRSCLIIGAGMSGLTAAATLQAGGWDVVIVEKEAGVGGRMGTRAIGQSRLDHGAQFITVRDERFASRMRDWERAGIVRPWFTSDDGHTRYCGTEGMHGIAAYLARDLQVETECDIVSLAHEGERWIARDERNREFHGQAVLLTAPAEQSLALCELFRPLLGRRLVQTLQGIHFEPCYSLLVVLDGESRVPEPGCVRPDDGVLSFVADNVRKGISAGAPALTLHSAPQFTIQHWGEDPNRIIRRMLEAASSFVTGPIRAMEFHRWRHSQPIRTEPARFASAHCPSLIYFAGDAFGGPRVEGAFLSGLETAERILETSE